MPSVAQVGNSVCFPVSVYTANGFFSLVLPPTPFKSPPEAANERWHNEIRKGGQTKTNDKRR